MRSFGHQGRIDGNHTDIVEALRKAGCTVQTLAKIGHGCPDLLVGRAGANYLLEVKYGKGELSIDELAWHQAWNGRVLVVRDVTTALAAVEIAKIHP